jgi:hypothetical protein
MGPPPPPKLSFADAQLQDKGLDQWFKDCWDADFEEECGFLPMGSALTGRLRCVKCGTYAMQGSNYCLPCQPVLPVGPSNTRSFGPR